MHKADWRSPAEYVPCLQHDRAGFAWEIIRRNPDYCRDYRRLKRMKQPDPQVVERFARHWGLRFRC